MAFLETNFESIYLRQIFKGEISPLSKKGTIFQKKLLRGAILVPFFQ